MKILQSLLVSYLKVFYLFCLPILFGYAALRVNEPPVAVIVPSSQTVHLPNNVAILDGRTSTDDTKIVSYKWNLEKGPISYQFEPKSQITLELNGMASTARINC